jgi:hypothetical protein
MARFANGLLERSRPALVRGADVVGRATSDARALPGLLICGGQRCGTTSMYKALIQHPTILRPVWRKGVHYFDTVHHHDIGWYRAHFPFQWQLDRAAHRHGTRALCFESSPYYLFHPLAADRIAADLPDVQVLVLVRDPVERAYSAHAHEQARGFEDLDFAQALEREEHSLAAEASRLRDDPTYESHLHRHQAYRARGEYVTQLERFAALIGRDRLKVVDSHRFFAEPEQVFPEVLAWLDVAPRGRPTFDRHNSRARSQLDPVLRRELEDYYLPFDDALTDWLGHVPTWRR